MAAFSVNEFYQRNRRVVIWVILFLLLWALRDFFAVVFLSFVLAIIAAPLAEIGMRRLGCPHWAAVTVVYVIFLVVLGTFVAFVVPSVVTEAQSHDRKPAGDRGDADRDQEPCSCGAIPPCASRSTAICAARSPTIASDDVELELISERQRLGLTEGDLAAAAESPVVPTGVLAEYFNRQDQLLLNALMAVQSPACPPIRADRHRHAVSRDGDDTARAAVQLPDSHRS